MEQKYRELLLKDLCSRLPYKVVVDYAYNAFDVHNGNYVKHGSKCILKCHLLDVFMSPRQNEKGEYIKPYLRPMSSMTDEEYDELNEYAISKFIGDSKEIDWLNKHHFDYRGLIPMGLAIEVTKENNPYKTLKT